MPRGVRGSGVTMTSSVADSVSSAAKTGLTKSVKQPVKIDRQVEIMHHGVGHHSKGALINESELGDRANLRRLVQLGAVRLYVPAPADLIEPEIELDDDEEEVDDEAEDDAQEEDSETEESKPEIKEEVVDKSSTGVPNTLLTGSSLLLTKVTPSSGPSSQTNVAVPPAATGRGI